MADLTTERERVDVVLASEPNEKVLKKGWFSGKTKLAVRITKKGPEIRVVVIEKGYVKVGLDRFDVFPCYCSPNRKIDELKTYINNLINRVKNNGRDAIIAADLNAKSHLWGFPITYIRGEHLEEWLAEFRLSGDKRWKHSRFL